MTLARQDLEREAAATGFAADPLEKVIRLLSLLNALRSHPFLKGRIALKGGGGRLRDSGRVWLFDF